MTDWIRLIALTACSALSLATFACDDDDERSGFVFDGGFGVGGRGNDAGGTFVPGEELSDAQIAGVSETVNLAEVQQGELALERAENADVRAFAQLMVTEHGMVLDAQGQLLEQLGIEPATSQLRNQLEAENQQILLDLQDDVGSDFDDDYMEAQVDVHSRVLELLQEQLIPQAESEELRALLEGMEPAVAEHLDMARQIDEEIDDGILGGR